MAASGEDEKIMKGISNGIKCLVAPDPAKGQPNTECFVLRTGFSIDPTDYDPAAKVDPTEDAKAIAGYNLAKLVNDIPKINAAWEPTGSYVSTEWQLMLKTAKAPLNPPPTESMKEKYAEAIKKLYGSEDNYERLLKSPFYQSLGTARREVANAQRDLVMLQIEIQKLVGKDGTQAQYDRKYEQMSPTYTDALTEAQEQYMLRKRAIEVYLTVLNAYTTGSLETVLMNMSRNIQAHQGSSDGELYYKVTATPADWWKSFEPDYQSDDGWTEVTVNQSLSTHTGHDTYDAIGGSTGFVLFSFGGSESKHVKTTSDDTKGMQISFKMKTVDIDRQWLEMGLLNYKSITMGGAQAGQWSTGVLEPGNKGTFPLLPTALVLAKDISVTASEFSSHARDTFEQYSASAGGFWDLFCFSGGGSHTSHTNTATWNKDTQTMTVSGVQIIGAVCSLTPYFPAKSS